MGKQYGEVQWGLIKRMWEAGATYSKIGRTLNEVADKYDNPPRHRWIASAKDPDAPIRKIISRGIREGFWDWDANKHVFLKRRQKPEPPKPPKPPKPQTKAEWLAFKQERMRKKMEPLKYKTRGRRERRELSD